VVVGNSPVHLVHLRSFVDGLEGTAVGKVIDCSYQVEMRNLRLDWGSDVPVEEMRRWMRHRVACTLEAHPMGHRISGTL